MQTREGRIPYDDRGRDWSAASQGTARIAGKPPEAGKRQGRILPYRYQRDHGSAGTQILDLASRTRRQ